ncbi:alpha-2-macroglobulin-like protein 1 [Garra rufa]|uniref:alpha-2-macroglobulin-like protein 1 n=1 Tax=Garra rufa TaxID=137080 RepID=UPI003CCED49E
MEKYISDSLAAGFIRPSSSPAGAGFFFVGKKDGSLRPCIDYRGLNNITVKNTYPLPLISSAFERLQGASVFTKLDLRNAYHLVRIRRGDEWKTAFNTPRGHFEYLVMPFGLSNSPGVFQALVNDVLRDMVDQFIYVYLDDILIFSSSLQEHVQHVRRVLQRLLENGLFVKAEKCDFHAQSVPFLGYILSAEGVRVDPAKVQAVVDWPTPDSRKALQRFLGFANFYRRFVRNYSQLAAPLTALTSPRTTFRWSDAAEAAFTKLKSRFVSAPILVTPDPSRQFVVEVDASEVGWPGSPLASQGSLVPQAPPWSGVNYPAPRDSTPPAGPRRFIPSFCSTWVLKCCFVLPRRSLELFQTVELQDPYSNRIGQWLNQTTRIGILDLSHSMSPEATQGYYTITAKDEKNQQISQRFEIKEYVLPKFEVKIDFPTVLTVKDEEVTLKVCGIYTYDKPVLGSVNTEVCVQSNYYKPVFPNKLDVCKKYSMMADKTGCGSQVINVSTFGLSSGGSFQVNCNMTESGTGITMQGSTSAVIIYDYVRVHFEDTPDTYRPGMDFEGKIVVTNSQSRPMENEPVIVYALYGGKKVNVTLTTDISGTVDFSFSTSDWSEETVKLWANHKGGKKRPDSEAYTYYASGYHDVRPLHSEDNSFLLLTYAPENPSCHNEITVMVRYTIDASALKLGQTTLQFSYMHVSFLFCSLTFIKVITGDLKITLNDQHLLVPFAQVVVYTILPSGEAVAGVLRVLVFHRGA